MALDIQIPNEPSLTMNDVGGSAADFNKTLNANEDAAFNQYKMVASNMEKPLDIYGRMESDAGLPQMVKTASTLQGQVNDVEDSIRRVEGNVNATTGNSIVTEGQRQGMIEARKNPLIEKLGWITTGLGRVSNAIQQGRADIGTKVGLALQGQQQELDPYKMRIQMVADQSARAMTGFTADRQTQLDILMDKLNRTRTLSDREWQQAADLAKLEKDYSLKKDSFLFEQNNTASSLDTEVVTVGGRKKLINKQTGQVISDLGASSDGSSNGGLQHTFGSLSNTQTGGGGDWAGSIWDGILSGGGSW